MGGGADCSAAGLLEMFYSFRVHLQTQLLMGRRKFPTKFQKS